MTEYAIEVNNLKKNFGEIQAVKGVSFKVKKREIFAYLGPNGAGKTTTINMLITLLKPTAGTAKVNGYDIITEQDKVRRSIAVVFQEQTLDEDLTAWDNLMLHAKIYGIPKQEAKQEAKHLLDLTGLWERRYSRVKHFSGGMRRRLEIARGLLTNPKVLFLDEPTIGLDPQSRALIWEKIQEISKVQDITIFLTSHQMDEVEEFAHTVAIMDLGEIKVIGSPDELKDSIGNDVVRFKVTEQKEKLIEVIRKMGYEPHEAGDYIEVGVKNGAEFLGEKIREISSANIPIKSIEVKKPSLNDVFLHYTGRELRDAMASFADRINMPGANRRILRRRH